MKTRWGKWGSKMAATVRNPFGSPGLRLVQLHILLSSTGRPFTLSRLAGIFHCSRQTILRLMDQLSRVRGVNLETWVHNRERHYRARPRCDSSAVAFTAESLRHLTFCRDIVRHLLPKNVEDELQHVLGSTADRLRLDEDGMTESYAHPLVKGRIDYSPFQTTFEDIQLAMRKRRLCRVDYLARSSGDRHHYLVAPLRLIVYREAFYLRCRVCSPRLTGRDRFRTLAVHRISRLRVNSDTFTDKPEDDAEPHFGFPFHEPIRVRAAFCGSAATYVAERIWSADQTIKRRRDGSIELIFTATSTPEVISWILSFGPDAELLEPRELREEVLSCAEEILRRYHGPILKKAGFADKVQRSRKAKNRAC